MAELELAVVANAAPASWTVVTEADVVYMPNNGDVDLEIDNQSDQEVEVTIREGRACAYGHLEQVLEIVATDGEVTSYGPLRKDRFNQRTGRVKMMFSIPGTGVVRACGRRRT